MKIVEMRLEDFDIQYKIFEGVNKLPKGSVIIFKINLGQIDINTTQIAARQIRDYFESRGIDTLFIPDAITIDSVNTCKEMIGQLSKELYKYSELQDKLLEGRERYESF